MGDCGLTRAKSERDLNTERLSQYPLCFEPESGENLVLVVGMACRGAFTSVLRGEAFKNSKVSLGCTIFCRWLLCSWSNRKRRADL